MSVFDGLADIFTDPTIFGELVLYTPAATGRPVTINAVWIENYVSDFSSSVPSDAKLIRLDVRTVDVPEPAEGDLVRRIATGFDGEVFPPIKPDGVGIMISLTVQQLLP